MKNRSPVIYCGFALFLLVIASLSVVPKWAAGGKQNLDAGIAALGMIMLIALVALLIAIVLVVLAIVLRRSISKLAMVCGIAPLPLLLVLLLVGWMLASSNGSQQGAPPPNRKPTAPAVDLPVAPK